MAPSPNPNPNNDDPVLSRGSANSDILNRLSRIYSQMQSHQLRVQNPQQNQQPLQLNASQSRHQQPQQNQSIQHQQQQQNCPLKRLAAQWYQPSLSAQRLIQFMHDQLHRPRDNNIQYWTGFVSKYFAPNANMKLCVSSYGSNHRNPPQDVWHCELCCSSHGNGFEASVEVFPRLFKVKYESMLEENLCVDTPREYMNRNEQIVLHYKEVQEESVFVQFRVVRNGRLRIVFNPDMKIYSWEFCTISHTESSMVIPQANLSVPELHNNNTCNMLVGSAGESMEFGYPRTFIRTLQMAEVIIDLMDQTQEDREQLHQLQIDANSENGSPGGDEISEYISEVTVESRCMELGDDFVESAKSLNVDKL